MAAGEVVLMYRLEGDRGRKLKMIFVQNGLRIRQIPREEYNLSLIHILPDLSSFSGSGTRIYNKIVHGNPPNYDTCESWYHHLF